MKNIQIIDGASNATFSVFQATDAEFAMIFPNDQDLEFIEDFVERVGDEAAGALLSHLWERPTLKRNVHGIHGTLFYDGDQRREHLPASKREADWEVRSISEAQRRLFRESR